MPAYVELWVEGVRDRVPLEAAKITIGHAGSNDVALTFDPTASRLHAVLEPLAGGWCVRDLSSRNGTHVNGERIWGEQPLRPGDEIRVGQTKLYFRVDSPVDQGETTAGAERPPDITRRERDVLLALCGPLASESVFREPASIRDIAHALVVTDAAVKQHLSRLYDKFDIQESGERRRVRLANEAVRRGAVSMAEITEWVKRRDQP